MLNYIWVALLIVGLVVGIANGKIDAVGKTLLDASNDAVTFCIGLLGVVSLWCGLMRIFQDAGGINFISKLISPVIRKLFPETRYNKKQKRYCHKPDSELLGLGNGATPSGIAAVHELERTNPNTTARKAHVCFSL